tara:strand:- start:788 stop:2179 length:1392 start_codon:yes stop_codon:yes gene_type:complete
MTNINTFQGQLGIGTNDPDYKLDLQDTSQAADYILSRLYTSAANSGTSSTGLRIEKGAGYGGIVKGFLSQGVGSGLSFHTLSGNTDLQVMNINNSGNVGIGTNLPKDDLHIFEASNGQTTGLFIEKQTGASGTAQITFGVAAGNEGSTGKAKAGIFFERTAGNGRGELHFCVDSSSDNNGVALSDVRMVISNAGDVGVGTDAPGAKLDVKGAVILTGGGHGTRPANDGGVLANAEIRGGPGTGSAGFLRLSGGGYNNGSAADATSKTYIDLCGYSGNSDFDRNMTFNTLNQERMRINLGGNVGIGSTAPTQVLDVAGHIGCTGLVTGGVLIRSAANLNISAGTFIKVADYSSLVVGGNNYLVTVAWNSYVAGGSQVLWIGAASWYSSTQGGAQRIYAPWNSNQVVAATQVYHFRTISAFSFVESAVTPTGGNYQAHGIQMTNTQSTGTANAVSAKVRLIGSWT